MCQFPGNRGQVWLPRCLSAGKISVGCPGIDERMPALATTRIPLISEIPLLDRS
jgi:hypothetical protein